MLFNSLSFVVFFPTVTILYFASPGRWRWSVLLAASCWFYAAFIPKYLLVLFLLIAIDYLAGIAIAASAQPRRRVFLLISLIANLSVLGFFKYFNFVGANLAVLLQASGLAWSIPHLGWILPIGLSFHTFQSMSYTIEVYRGRQPPERHLGIYALYVMFYPQLVAGPIERPQNLIHQLREPHHFDVARVSDGLKLMLWGLFKKVVIADRLALVVNQVYGAPHQYTGVPLLVATYCFAFQIYCDFSGYSDIAIGAAHVMGIRLMTNFDRPYFAKSIAEFWRRWHISLSSWFRDYLYVPLGGNRVAPSRWRVNVFLVFLLSGLWHGANWTFAIWGALHGAYILIGSLTAPLRSRMSRASVFERLPWLLRSFQVLITFHLVLIAWVFFRANTVADAVYILSHAVTGLRLSGNRLGFNAYFFLVSVGAIVFLETIDLLERRHPIRHLLDAQPAILRWGYYYVLIALLLNFGMFRNPAQFIYFQF